MKLSALMLGLLVCASSFAAEINGLKVTGLPTVSQSYSIRLRDGKEIVSSKEALQTKCLAGKASGEAFARQNGFKIISSKGCDVKVDDRSYCDMCESYVDLDTSFEIVIK